ncbi:MAG: UvrD-helicase domain-containing protein, partial [Clostridiales bacterium]|nr:UvrD-helicase domain-containing protein [Clostridiales bacterium]
MAVKWTKEQEQVIESRGKNLLVSAAAGSGKTAVLVERIIRLVTEGEHPADIDRLLVMTFTNAAAAEMRERIGAAMEAKLSERPDDVHLQMQAALVHHAQITTIDSFCLRIIREHFHELDLDPSFRVGDEGELLLLREDVMKEMLEDHYENGGSRFEQFVETYATGKGDAGIEDYIMQVYTFSQSHPYPEQWIADCRAELSFGRATDDAGQDR